MLSVYKVSEVMGVRQYLTDQSARGGLMTIIYAFACPVGCVFQV